tara:strand:+ start:61 stop:1188 length:1128 start_codon:yes stop_codon:yes gene_type:complete
MKTKVLKTNLEVSLIGQGTLFGRANDKSDLSELVKKKISTLDYGIELGMNFIDTGEDYEDGKSEELLSQVISTKRDKVIIGSKFKPSNNGYENVIRSCEGSLTRLKTDYIDFYQIQWPNPNIPIEKTIEALTKLVTQGKIRYFGVGNFNIIQLNEALKYDKLNKLCVLQTEYDLFNRQIEDEILDFNSNNQISTIAYMSLGKNLFSNKEQKVLNDLSNKYDTTIRSIVLNWITSHPNTILLTSSTSKEHTFENYNSLSFKMDEKDIDLINKTFKRKTVKVIPKEIMVLDFDESDTSHKIYTSVEEAIENKLDIQPSAIEISEEIKKNGNLLRPIELKRNPDLNSKFPYVLVRGRMRFWGWVIAYGFEKEIDCKLF